MIGGSVSGSVRGRDRQGAYGLLFLLLPAVLCAADEWPQFRGNPQLTGVAAATDPANLSLLWTYEAGDSIASSAAISPGSVSGAAPSAHLLAPDAGARELHWKYPAKEAIGEWSRA